MLIRVEIQLIIHSEVLKQLHGWHLIQKFSFLQRLFGKNDLKLYAEGAILGCENYPGWYNNIYDRMPIMFGFNFPTFKLLDVLAIEAEYFPSPYKNSYHVYLERKLSGSLLLYVGKMKFLTIQIGSEKLMMTGSGLYMHPKK